MAKLLPGTNALLLGFEVTGASTGVFEIDGDDACGVGVGGPPEDNDGDEAGEGGEGESGGVADGPGLLALGVETGEATVAG